MKYPFTHIAVIYNPKSTGDGQSNAKQFRKQLKSSLPQPIVIELIPTKHAGHAEQLAYDYARAHKKLLIISSSGDGGYNEVVNGVIKSKNPTAIVAVLPSGNANDHDRAMGDTSLHERIVSPNVKPIDAIRITAVINGKPWERYAHSYIGFGLTAYIGKKLTEAELNSFNEKWLVLKYMILFKNVTLKIAPDLRWHHYSSVVFSNVDRMSKVIKLAPEAHLKDDRIEMYVLRSRSFIRMIFSLIFASTVGLRPTAQVENQALSTKNRTEVQLDGEVETIDAGSNVVVSVANDAIRTLL